VEGTLKERLTRSASQAQTRDRLLEAARRLFARTGYGGASVDAIAAEAGYSKGAFYSNFESKEAIFLELLEQHMAGEAEQLSRLVEAGGGAADILANLDAWFRNLDADWALLAMELQLHSRRSAVFASQYEALHAKHADRLGALLRKLFTLSGKKLPTTGASMAGALIALAHGLVLQPAKSHKATESAGSMMSTVLRSLIAAAPQT